MTRDLASEQPDRSKIGRPTRLTSELKDQIVTSIREGNFVETAARSHGVPDSTLYRWLQDGQRGRQPYRDFRDAVERAKAEAEVILVGTIHAAAARGSWRAALRLLESIAPQRWRVTSRPIAEESGIVRAAAVESPAAQIRAELDRIAARLRENEVSQSQESDRAG